MPRSCPKSSPNGWRRLFVDTDARVKPNALGAWRSVMATCNAPAGADDFVTRWLVLTRACVQPMTLTAAALAGLLAARAPGFNAGLFLLAAAGLLIAHGANNLLNDVFDERLGADTADYPRALYDTAPGAVWNELSRRDGASRASPQLRRPGHPDGPCCG